MREDWRALTDELTAEAREVDEVEGVVMSTMAETVPLTHFLTRRAGGVLHRAILACIKGLRTRRWPPPPPR
jgi:hypothetical protein